MKKKQRHGWQKCLAGCILLALCLRLPLWAQEPADTLDELRAALQEAVVARDAAGRRNAELEAALKEAEKELAGLRRRYTELYLAAQQRQEELVGLQTRIVGLLADQQDPETGQALSQALAYLADASEGRAELVAAVTGFAAYLQTILDVIQPSDMLRREITDRFAAVQKLADRLVRIPSIVAGRGGDKDRSRRECRILAVNDELQVVVVDAGTLDGMRPGTLWHVLNGEQIVGTLKIIELRPSISAGMVTEGNLKDIAPGMPVNAGSVGLK